MFMKTNVVVVVPILWSEGKETSIVGDLCRRDTVNRFNNFCPKSIKHWWGANLDADFGLLLVELGYVAGKSNSVLGAITKMDIISSTRGSTGSRRKAFYVRRCLKPED